MNHKISEGNIFDIVNVNEIDYYLGAQSFMTQEEYSNFITLTLDADGKENEYEKIVEATNEILKTSSFSTSTYGVVIDKPLSGTEVGIYNTEPVINSFKSIYWINDSSNFGDLIWHDKGICGSISSGMLLTYYNQKVTDIFDKEYAYNNSKYPYSIVKKLVPLIEGVVPGAFVDQVKLGINDFLNAYDIHNSGLVAYDTTSRSKIDSKLSNNRPVIIYLGSGGPYGLHYVLGFSYLKNNDNSEKWYHVADNHGNLAWVNNLWATGFVYLNK